MDQNKNKMVNALNKADMEFTILGTSSTLSPANSVKNLPIIIKNGAPGGWPTSSLNAEEMNSPQSQKLAEGSMVDKYTIEAMAKVIQPAILFISLKFFMLTGLIICEISEKSWIIV